MRASCSSRIILTLMPKSKGAEFELSVRPGHWDFGLSATYVKAEITKSVRVER